MFKVKKWKLATAITGAVFAVAIAGVWLFGGSTVVSAAESVASTVLAHRGGPGGWFKGGSIDLDQLLADALGITTEDLEAARESANEAAVAQAIEEGLITQEEVDEMEAQKALRESLAPYLDHDALMAKALGMTVEELQAALEAGTSKSDLLSELGIDEATYRENMTAAREAALAQAVEDGVITQEQADAYPMEHGRDRGMMPGGEGGHGRGFDRGTMDEGDVDGTRFRFQDPATTVDDSDA